MRKVGVLEAKTQLSALLDAVERGEGPIVITRHGKPVAMLSRDAYAAGRRLTGRQLMERLKTFRAGQAPDAELDARSWDELRDAMRQ